MSANELVRVRWMDAQDLSQTWASAKEVEEFGDAQCVFESVGYMVRKTEKYLTLARDRDPEDGDTFGGVTKIPVAWILAIDPLTVV